MPPVLICPRVPSWFVTPLMLHHQHTKPMWTVPFRCSAAVARPVSCFIFMYYFVTLLVYCVFLHSHLISKIYIYNDLRTLIRLEDLWMICRLCSRTVMYELVPTHCGSKLHRLHSASHVSYFRVITVHVGQQDGFYRTSGKHNSYINIASDIDVGVMSVRPSVCRAPIFHRNGLTYHHTFLTVR